jgi:uncharacterized protein
MKIGIIGANGKSGSLIVKEVLAKGIDVTAIVRDANKVSGLPVIEKDIMSLTYEDLKGFDVVIDAFAAWTPETLILHQTTLKHLSDILAGSNIRLLVVGGAGSLYVNPEHTMQVKDTEGFPDAFKALATNMSLGLDALRKRDDVRWTYLSPAADFVADGERTGKYVLGEEELIVNSSGVSQISYADYAIAMVDEVINANHINKRFTVVAK